MVYLLRYVAPLAGAWIETALFWCLSGSALVAPLAGAWIETPGARAGRSSDRVAPLAGAWIETRNQPHPCDQVESRSPRGSVD